MNNKLVIMMGLFAFVFLGIAAIRPVKAKHENLKVLPKDISQGDLDSVMTGFQKALGVDCEFCHAKNKANSAEIDFVSDSKPEKEITRKMMKMTEAINKEFFNYTITYKTSELMAVNCNTCHGGNPRPELKGK